MSSNLDDRIALLSELFRVLLGAVRPGDNGQQPRHHDARIQPQSMVTRSNTVPELETLNSFCLSRFSQVCQDLLFLPTANLDTYM